MRFVVAVLFVALGIWVALPSRNVQGNPAFEERTGQCSQPDGTIVRLYQGNGGATTSFWYSVTTKPWLLMPERQVAYSYSTPAWYSLSCGKDGIVLSGSGTQVLPADELEERRAAPLTYFYGNREIAPRSFGMFDVVRIGIGLLIVIAGGPTVLWRRRRWRTTVDPHAA